MNTPNNKRRQETRSRIERTFVQLLQTNELEDISVTMLCRLAEVNRTTFYANYIDIFDLVDAVGKQLEEDVLALYPESQTIKGNLDFLTLFRHIYENQIFYKTYFKLGLDTNFSIPAYAEKISMENKVIDRNLEYRVEFFRAGLNAILKKWLANGCRETPEEIHKIIQTEYEFRSFPEQAR